MFVRAISILTSLAMLSHSIGGCCWQHDHGRTTMVTSTESSNHLEDGGVRRAGHRHHFTAVIQDSGAGIPCHHTQHCKEGSCRSLKAVPPDLSKLDPSQILFAHAVDAELEGPYAVSLQNCDRAILTVRETLSAQQHCARSESWLL